MAMDVNSSSPHLDLDHLPLAERRRLLLWPPLPPRAEPSPPALDRCKVDAATKGDGGAALQGWPGLPRGVQFNPSDIDLLWHLAAEVGNDQVHRHPFIGEFIKYLDEDKGFSCIHPQYMPGVRQDGRASYFFHRTFKINNNENDKYISWQKIGTPKPIILNGSLRGCKEVFILHSCETSDSIPQRTDWRLHQYHIGSRMKDERELVVLKIFYESQNNRSECAGEALAASAQEICAALPIIDSVIIDNNRRLQTDDLLNTEISPTECLVDSANRQRACSSLGSSILSSAYGVISCCPDGSAKSDNNLVAPHRHCQQAHETGYAVTPLCLTPHLDMCRSHLCVKTERSTNNNDSETVGAKQLTADNSGLLSISGRSAPAAPSPCQIRNFHDPVEDTEHQNNGESASFGAGPLSDSTTLCGNKNTQLLRRKPLVDVKLEPTVEGYEIYPIESTHSKSHHTSENGGLEEDASSVPECFSKESEMHGKGNLIENSPVDCTCSKQTTAPGSNVVGSVNSISSEKCKRISVAASSQAKSAYEEEPVPSLVMKSELAGGQFSGLCVNNLLNISEPIVKTTRTGSLNHDECIAKCSRQRKRRKTAMDSIEKALEEDAPGLLQILLNKGILLEEIKLYGDEVLPDCIESDFEDLENVIAKLFPQKASLLKFPAARRVKGEKAVYCLACLISLIEQSRYLQFRDCAVEWGWCRELQSFIFVFESHNRIVLERPEYGYATYFFEVVQLLPIEWQIRRLVTAMKLTGCGRTALIENKPLLVGEDLTENEAQVLKEYGWMPNTGLGTMLNYRNRVVHDRWNEANCTEWRSKIGKLLMTGYVEGQAVLTQIPKKLGKLLRDENTEIKLEDPV